MNHEKFHKIIKFQQYFFKKFFCKKKIGIFFQSKISSKNRRNQLFQF